MAEEYVLDGPEENPKDTLAANVYDDVWRLRRDGQGIFKLTEEEIRDLYHYVSADTSHDEGEKVYADWLEAAAAIEQIARHAERDFSPDYVVGVARGGLPLAVPLSHRLDVPMGAVWATHYDGEERQGEVEVENYGLAKVSNGDRVLLVDDVADTGRTLDEITTMWDEQDTVDFEWWTAVWHEKVGSVHSPNISIVRGVDEWIVYPWEHNRGWKQTKIQR